VIQAKIRRNRLGPITGYTIEGHAGAAAKGLDIVCAAVSVLSTTITNELDIAYIESNTGMLKVVGIPPNAVSQVLARTLVHGLMDIEEQYPDNVHIEIIEE
jgi:uncharacterized protein YsxB (DUF464 family)